jgi:hypothetical protein
MLLEKKVFRNLLPLVSSACPTFWGTRGPLCLSGRKMIGQGGIFSGSVFFENLGMPAGLWDAGKQSLSTSGGLS